MGGEFGLCFLDSNDLTKDDKEICSIIDSKSIDAEAGERRKDAAIKVIKVIDSKSIDAEERDEEDAAIRVQGEAEGNEAVKDLLKGEFNVSNGQEDLIPDDTEILGKGGGKKEKTVRMQGGGN